MFFFLGRNDHWVPPEVSVAYFEALDRALEEARLVRASGHEPFADEPAKFNAGMAELVHGFYAPIRPQARLDLK